MGITHGLRRSLQIYAGGIATIDGVRRRTWQEVGERVARAAGALRGMGVSNGDRVAILALNSDRYFELYLAIAWAGAVVVPLNTIDPMKAAAEGLAAKEAKIIDAAKSGKGLEAIKAAMK